MITIAAAVFLAATTSGCTSASPQAVDGSAEFDDVVDRIESLEGVEHVELYANERTSAASLSVMLDGTVETGPLEEIGAAVSGFVSTANDRGYQASEPLVRHESSTFSYFNGVDPEIVGEQLGYWMALQQFGAEAVKVRTYTGNVDVPASGLHADEPAEPVQQQPPRYVLVELPHDESTAAQTDILSGLASVRDPGATGGQWDFLNLAPNTKGQYASPNFPSSTELSYAVTAGNHFAEVAGMANIEVVRDRGHDTPLQIRIAVFDGSMDGVDSAAAEEAFARTQAWQQLNTLIAMLESAGSLDYGVEVLANPLSDGGNFQLEFSVHGCQFTGDPDWPVLAGELDRVWHENRAAERKDANPGCDAAPTPDEGTPEAGDTDGDAGADGGQAAPSAEGGEDADGDEDTDDTTAPGTTGEDSAHEGDSHPEDSRP
ncbi:hypothetical protein [Gulosibacter sp. 10]|uniref:hypothetical protein n=1 Tax=Gulosibacter sp. 10 TaxID=1255570 RepID=UPI00097E7E78|nr:hypothetical protein [Gulosibacter sp. 10]SJM59879.1 hypothetical protein FM112_06845 [Gulosibacter sp. 10]